MPNPVYPTLAIDPKESDRVVRDGRDEDDVGDGAMRVRKLHADKFDFNLKHPFLTSAQMTTLQTFYNSYGTSAAIDFTWPEDGVTYTVRFGKTALRTRWASPTRRHAWVRLVGV